MVRGKAHFHVIKEGFREEINIRFLSNPILGIQNLELDKDELKLFQSFPLDVKMGKTALRIRELAEHDFYVSFSGGKDSEVAVDFVARTLSEIGIQQMYVANVNTGLEYLSVQRFCNPFCEMVSKKYSIKIILDTLYPKITF